ncbi:MAG: sialidase family protein, partial [Candidatus Hodarchaeales archaeon]
DNIHVVWGDSRHYPVTNRAEIYYINSTDEGKTWNPEVRLTFSDSTKLDPQIAESGNNIHIVWTDDRDGGREVFYKNSSDSGKTWCFDRKITQSSGTGYYTDITVNGSNIHVVYIYDFKLFYLNSTDNGITWSEPQQLTGPIRDSDHPAIAVNGSNVHIVWMDHYDRFGTGTAGAIFYINSSNNGLTWSEDFNLSYMNLDAGYTDIAVEGENVHVIFNEQRGGLYQIYYRRSEDNGITWTDEVMVSNSTDDIARSAIKVKNNAVFATWGDEKNPIAEVYLRNSSDNGQNWNIETRMTYDPAACAYPNIAIGNESLHLVWSDWRDGAPEIYYKYYPFYYPPTNLTIDIWGTNLILNWTTPQTGLSLVDYYLIYQVTDPEAFTFSDLEIIYNSSGTGNDLLTTWNDTTALLDEANNYYYVVRAVYENGEIDTNENIVGKFVISLNQGWNLFSIPLSQNTSISEVLKSIDGQYNIIQWYDAKNGIWRSSPSGLININRTMGFWVHLRNKCNMSVVGAMPESTDIVLYEGWNLVGYPSLKTRNLNDALGGISWRAVQQYDAFDPNDPWKHNNTNKPDNLNDLKEMQPGRGYWVYITINDTWVRTRVAEDNKVVVWKVYGLEEKGNDQRIYESIVENPMDIEEEDSYQIDNIPEKPTITDKENNLAISLIPLIILIT